MSRDTWTVCFRPEGDGPPAAIRVRRLLKIALRCCGLRCVAVEQNGPAKAIEGAADTSAAVRESTPQNCGEK